MLTSVFSWHRKSEAARNCAFVVSKAEIFSANTNVISPEPKDDRARRLVKENGAIKHIGQRNCPRIRIEIQFDYISMTAH